LKIKAGNSTRPSRVSTIALYLAFAAIALQTQSRITDPNLLPSYIYFFAAFLLLFTLALLFTRIPFGLFNLYFAIQSAIILFLLSLDPESDVVLGLFAILCYQAAMVFKGRIRWAWIAILVVLTVGSLIFFLGPLSGLALSMTPAGIALALAFLVFANQEIEAARIESEALLGQLEKNHVQLEAHAEQVQALTTLEERNRLARELHDAVSQTMFSITLTTRSAQMLMEKDPALTKPLLEQLQTLTNSALAELRGLVAKLRPVGDTNN
jgi:signal transduction histidine kinase